MFIFQQLFLNNSSRSFYLVKVNKPSHLKTGMTFPVMQNLSIRNNLKLHFGVILIYFATKFCPVFKSFQFICFLVFSEKKNLDLVRMIFLSFRNKFTFFFQMQFPTVFQNSASFGKQIAFLSKDVILKRKKTVLIIQDKKRGFF